MQRRLVPYLLLLVLIISACQSRTYEEGPISLSALTETPTLAPTSVAQPTATLAPTMTPTVATAATTQPTNTPDAPTATPLLAVTQTAATNTPIPPTATAVPATSTQAAPTATPIPTATPTTAPIVAAVTATATPNPPTPTAASENWTADVNVDYFRSSADVIWINESIELSWGVTGVDELTLKALGGPDEQEFAEWTLSPTGTLSIWIAEELDGYPLHLHLKANGQLIDQLIVSVGCTNAWAPQIAAQINQACPATSITSFGSQQVFENGIMVWIQDEDLIMYTTWDGNGAFYEDTFEVSRDIINDPAIVPPTGRFQPEYGFGKIWREFAWVRDALGWAIEQPTNYNVEHQSTSTIASASIEFVTLTNDGFVTVNRAGPWQVNYARPAAASGNNSGNAADGSLLRYFYTSVETIEAGREISILWELAGAERRVELLKSYTRSDGATITRELHDVVNSDGPIEYWYTVPNDYRGEITFELGIRESDSYTIIGSTTVQLGCPNVWFFADDYGDDWVGALQCPSYWSYSTAAYQTFENGYMVWVEDWDRIIVSTWDGSDTWDLEDLYDGSVHPVSDPSIYVPDGFLQPEYGFGRAWRDEGWIREILGWATAPAETYTTQYQVEEADGPYREYLTLPDGRLVEISQPSDAIMIID